MKHPSFLLTQQEFGLRVAEFQYFNVFGDQKVWQRASEDLQMPKGKGCPQSSETSEN